MMILGPLTLVVTLLQSILLYLVGRILSKPTELRLFLGLNRFGEDTRDFASVSAWIETIGRILKVLSVMNAVSSILSIR